MSQTPRVLVVEDDRSLREGLAMNLRRQGYEVLLAADGDEGMAMAFDERADIIILDIMMPGFSGLDILDELRSRKVAVPVLVLSARGRLEQRVQGLKLGADDYLPKPFDLGELLARVEALLRRSGWQEDGAEPVILGDVELDLTTRTATVSQAVLSLTTREFDVLLLLARSPGRVFSRSQIIEQIWGWDFEGTERTVDNYIVSLRKKLAAANADCRIATVRGLGYRLEQ